VGAVSGAGGSTRLLVDYPEPYRGQILDALFKPGVGAALQLLKVEIGGDVGSVDGAEPSHLHSSNDLGCNRGYEWWLMQQAKARNPAIALYGLAWGAPGFVGGGSYWSQGMIDYLLAWLTCAKNNGLIIDYLGGWNENGYDKSWYENLHSALASNGFSTKIVGADDVTWAVADDMTSDTVFGGAVDVVGVHNPCGGPVPPMHCASTANAVGLGKPLWATANGPLDSRAGAAAMAAAMNRGYLDAKLTAYFAWPLIAAANPAVPSPTAGLVVASQPWSASYDLGKSLWVIAHTAQFAQPGWKYVDSASGYLGTAMSPGGSYVTLQSPAGKDYAIVLETTGAQAAQTVGFASSGAAASAGVHVWATDLGSRDPARDFVHAGDVTPAGGAFWVTLQPNFLYTVTTTTGQGKVHSLAPVRASLGLPYVDSFESHALASQAPNLADQEGAFEVVACGGGRNGQCLRQMAPTAPIRAHSNGDTPYAVLGAPEWADYEVSADVMLEQPGSVEIFARYQTRDPSQLSHIAGYSLSLSDSGGWSIRRDDTGGGQSVLTSGNVAALNTNTWHSAALQLLGSTLLAKVDGAEVGTATDSTYAAGQVGLAAGHAANLWVNAQFDNLSIAPLGQATLAYTVRLLNRSTGLALDVAGQSTTDGAGITASADDEGSTSQEWQLAGDGSGALQLIDVHSGKALTEASTSADAGAQIVQTTASGLDSQRWQLQDTGDGFYRLLARGGAAADIDTTSSAVVAAPLDCTSDTQQWSLAIVPVVHAAYTLVNQASGLVLDIGSQSTSNGGSTILSADDGSASQRWRIEPLSGGDYTLVNGNSGLVLDIPGGNSSPGTQLEQWGSNGGSNQQWGLHPLGGGLYSILATNGNALDVAAAQDGGAVSDGAAVVENPVNGSVPSQAWRLVPAP
jgi:hypothetical protein